MRADEDEPGKGNIVVVGIGIRVGLVGTVAVAGLTQSMLYGTNARDPLTLSAVATLLALVALVACWLPARRATRVDPMVALRME